MSARDVHHELASRSGEVSGDLSREHAHRGSLSCGSSQLTARNFKWFKGIEWTLAHYKQPWCCFTRRFWALMKWSRSSVNSVERWLLRKVPFSLGIMSAVRELKGKKWKLWAVELWILKAAACLVDQKFSDCCCHKGFAYIESRSGYF